MLAPLSLLGLLAASASASRPPAGPIEKRFELFTTLEGVSPSGSASATATASGSAAQSKATYTSSILTPPGPPEGLATSLSYAVWESADALTDPARGNSALSIPQRGSFLGISIELSVSNQVLGPTSEKLRAPFLNFMQNLRARYQQGPRLRIGGNSQEGSMMFPVDVLPPGNNGGSFLEKAESTATITNTPDVYYTEDLIYAMANVTALLGVQWMYGLQFSNITEQGKANAFKVGSLARTLLGSNLLGLQLGNEPDLFPGRRRGDDYTMSDWFGEIGQFMTDWQASGSTTSDQGLFYLPSSCCRWSPQDVMNMGLIDTYGSRMHALTFQKYPDDNCNSASKPTDYAQQIFGRFMTHQTATDLVAEFTGPAQQAVQAGLEMVMAETNTGSCSGFSGLSDAFAASLWLADWTLTQAYHNFTQSFLHVGGRDAFYNPFTVVPSNQTSFRSWTVGAPYYTMLAMAETFGSTNTSQVVDITANGTLSQPAYAIYENNAPAKLAFINFVSDPSGASDYNAVVNIGGITEGSQRSTPSQVFVRYMRAPNSAEQYNITWAGQTASTNGPWTSDGTLTGTIDTVTIQCDTGAGTCTIPVPAPSYALVFLTSEALAASSGTLVASVPGQDSTATTFATTYVEGVGTNTVPDAVRATSNGQRPDTVGSTSKGGASAASPKAPLGAFPLLGGAAAAVLGLLSSFFLL